MHPDESDLRRIDDPLRRRQRLLRTGLEVLALKSSLVLCYLLYTQIQFSTLLHALRSLGRTIATMIGVRDAAALRHAASITVALVFGAIAVAVYALLMRAVKPWYRRWCAQHGLCECGRGVREAVVVSSRCDRCLCQWPSFDEGPFASRCEPPHTPSPAFPPRPPPTSAAA